MAQCLGFRQDGQPCRAQAVGNRAYCAFHDPRPDARARHREQSRRGGQNRARGAVVAVAPIGERVDVAQLDLCTAAGLSELVAATLAGLAELPLTERVANAVSQTVTAQMRVLESVNLEARVAALEAMQRV